MSDTLENTSMRILVTGGGGYIGGHLAHLLIEQGFEVVVFDDFSTGRREHIPHTASTVVGDIRNKEQLDTLFTTFKIDAVMHLAAKLEVEESVSQPQLYMDVNVQGTKNLLQSMQEHGVTKLVFSSTAAVYGEQEKQPISETVELKPNNPYGESKMLAESEIEAYTRDFSFSAVVLRYFNVAGKLPETAVHDTHSKSHVLPTILECAKEFGRTFNINGNDYNTFDGTCVRDYIHVGDVARAHIAALESLVPGFEVYNIGTGVGVSVQQLVQKTTEVTNRMIILQPGPRRAGDAAMTVADTTKIQQKLNWQPIYSDLENIIVSSWN